MKAIETDLFGEEVKRVKEKQVNLSEWIRKSKEYRSKIKYLMVLVSGGRSSARMAKHIRKSKKYKKYKIVYVFCNTGQERPETIAFLKNIVEVWGIPLVILEGVYSMEPGIGVKHKVVTFETMDMEGRVFSEMIAHLNKHKWTGVPNSATPYCSEYLKTRVSHSYAKEVFGTTKYLKAIGYRAEDMPKRVTVAELMVDTKRIAPLITDFDRPVNLLDLSYFFQDEPFRLTIESKFGNCELCWKKSHKNLVECIQLGTRFIEWTKEEEDKYGNLFYRENLSIMNLVDMAKSGVNMDLWDDEGDSCVCSFN